MPIFRVKSVKIYAGQKNLHEYSRGSRDKYEVCKWINSQENIFSKYPQIESCLCVNDKMVTADFNFLIWSTMTWVMCHSTHALRRKDVQRRQFRSSWTGEWKSWTGWAKNECFFSQAFMFLWFMTNEMCNNSWIFFIPSSLYLQCNFVNQPTIPG